MAFNTEKNTYTVLFAAVMVIVVGSLLAFVATALKPKIDENKRFEKQQNILYAMGVNRNNNDSDVVFIPTAEVEHEFSRYITEQLVIDSTGNSSKNSEAYLIDIKKQFDALKRGKAAQLPLFIGKKEGKTYYIIPLYGKGLWDAIWGYIAVDKNRIVQGVYFDHKGETPGLGANLKQRFFMDDFAGESILSGNRYVGVQVVKGNNDPLNKNKEDNQVDALTGATITGNGITAMIKESVELYKPYLKTLKTP